MLVAAVTLAHRRWAWLFVVGRVRDLVGRNVKREARPLCCTLPGQKLPRPCADLLHCRAKHPSARHALSATLCASCTLLTLTKRLQDKEDFFTRRLYYRAHVHPLAISPCILPSAAARAITPVRLYKDSFGKPLTSSPDAYIALMERTRINGQQ